MEICEKTLRSCSYSYRTLKCRCEKCKDYHRIAGIPYREDARKRSMLWRLKNLERSRENSKRYQREHPEMLLKWKLKKYNMTVNEYNSLKQKQHGMCAICGSSSSKKNFYHRLHVDHDHKTGKIRGLLCGNCNTALGKFQDNSKLLTKAIEYIREYISDRK